jgi:hypothetical protein
LKTTAALAIAALLAGLLLAAPWLRADAGNGEAVERGRAHVEKSCLHCHPGAELDALVRKKVADRALPAALDAFLSGHHAAEPALRADVLAALAHRLAAAGGD